jgi:hypothetical protein
VTEPRIVSPVVKSALIQRSLPSPDIQYRPLMNHGSTMGDALYPFKPKQDFEWRPDGWLPSNGHLMSSGPGLYHSSHDTTSYQGSSSPSTVSSVTLRPTHTGNGRTKKDREDDKKRRHMKKERKRRCDIKYETDRLRRVPGCDSTTAKATVYKRSYDYIEQLEKALIDCGNNVWQEFCAKSGLPANGWNGPVQSLRLPGGEENSWH